MAGVRRALAMGAHAGVLVSDERLRGADVLATARALAAALRRRPFDLVIAGTESTDGGAGTLPVALAECLGLPSVTFVRRLEVRRRRAPRRAADPGRPRRDRVPAARRRHGDVGRQRTALPDDEGHHAEQAEAARAAERRRSRADRRRDDVDQSVVSVDRRRAARASGVVVPGTTRHAARIWEFLSAAKVV